MDPLVSVIVPLYNCENYIENTLESVIKQTYKNIEIIIIDDGSTDKSFDKLKDFINLYSEKIKYFYQENSGVSEARNNGIKKSNGEYIAFLDSDDLWDKTKIEKQINRIKETSMGACYCGYHFLYEQVNETIIEKNKFIEGKILIPFLKGKVLLHTSTWLIKRSIIIENELNFTKGCNWGEDFEFISKVLALAEVCCVKEYLSLYRIRGNGSLSQFSLKYITDIDVFIRIREWIKDNYNNIIYKKINKIIEVINGYKIPNSIINVLYICLKNNFELDKCIEIYKNPQYQIYINMLKFNNGIVSTKLFTKKLILWLKLNNK